MREENDYRVGKMVYKNDKMDYRKLDKGYRSGE